MKITFLVFFLASAEALAPSQRDGYGLLGTLIRQGPVPLVTRITQPEKYELSVQVYMAKEGCSKEEAQGNMDAFFANQNEWTRAEIKFRSSALFSDRLRRRSKLVILVETKKKFFPRLISFQNNSPYLLLSPEKNPIDFGIGLDLSKARGEEGSTEVRLRETPIPRSHPFDLRLGRPRRRPRCESRPLWILGPSKPKLSV